MEVEHKLQRIEDKIDRIGERMNSVDVTLAAQHVSLEDHIRRTNLLEIKIEPVEKHVAMIQGALKLVGLLAICSAIIEGAVAFLTYIRK